jgi:hypothetical protein
MAAAMAGRREEVHRLTTEQLRDAYTENRSLLDRVDALRELLDEIGVMAANAPEDGDSFGLLEEITMLIVAAGVPDSTAPGTCPDCGQRRGPYCTEAETWARPS